ncbi:unnamed protein product [Microthlaspi erraticum]|uniref:F-box domain-containing protein n=1 Tax=Microthlaspi erraticum TaxID=1685480 RepID=A0A6D2HYF0_9BRAS|nr:unnamed protein product [Microthlaspi erraticum]
MSDIPLDLVEEILSRVPATSLKRFRTTCKLWNALIKEERFTEKHFRKAPKQSRLLMMKDNKICSMSVNLNVAPPTIELKGALDLKDSHSNSKQVDIAKVFHCDGLLLCTTKDSKLVVYNPCSGETRWIQLETTCVLGFSQFALGYQNNKHGRSYKILKIWDDDVHEPRPVYEFTIYEFKSDSWRKLLDVRLRDVDGCECQIKRFGNGVSLKGNAYWVAYGVAGTILFSFDFTRERDRRLCPPPSLKEFDWTALSVIREEKLSLAFGEVNSLKVEIWVTNQIDTDAAFSWSKSFALDLVDIPDCGWDGVTFKYLFWIVLVDEEKKVALYVNAWQVKSHNSVYKVYVTGEDDDYYTETAYLESSDDCLPFIIDYVPSLVQIRQSRRQKEKNEN